MSLEKNYSAEEADVVVAEKTEVSDQVEQSNRVSFSNAGEKFGVSNEGRMHVIRSVVVDPEVEEGVLTVKEHIVEGFYGVVPPYGE